MWFLEYISFLGELRNLIARSDKERSELQRRVEQHEIQERLKQEKEVEDRQRLAGGCCDWDLLIDIDKSNFIDFFPFFGLIMAKKGLPRKFY